MNMLQDIIFALGLLVSGGVAVKICAVGLHIMFTPDDKADGIKQIKFLLIILVIAICLSAGPSMIELIISYFQDGIVSSQTPPPIQALIGG